ncbi:hypothetical protein MNBD_NITROSPINAE04-2631 [hydrothermal vent metagenome]|uniref:Phosphate-specific outer membrane porin OprP Pyrophosphate-specific outer membrane porin OprO n=1 Tax=hydrothermal vent metagenome TaxID=652676 RepID=A0A3B1CGF4_9ZZZZ
MFRELLTAVIITSVISTSAFAGGVKYKDGDKYVKMGGRIQLQYHKVDPDGGESTDDVFFRRFRPYIEGSIHKDWKGKFQWDMGKAHGDNEIAVKDAYMQYKGIKNMKITVGNANYPFSREKLTSSKKQQLVERTFVGDHNYGTPDRQMGVYVQGHNGTKKFDWAVGVADARIDPDAKKLDFASGANDQKDWNEGLMLGGRISFHPFGKLKMSQGDFTGKTKATISVAAFSWSNDDDTNTRTDSGADTSKGKKPDVSKVTGVEISGAFRGAGFSVDAQYNMFDAKTVDSAVTSGIYENGSTQLTNLAIEGGYMFARKFEIVAGYSSQDADGYSDAWTRTAIGVNYFIHKHDIKVQATYRMNKNMKGQEGIDEDELFVQTQYVF